MITEFVFKQSSKYRWEEWTSVSCESFAGACYTSHTPDAYWPIHQHWVLFT